jgi:hypothetical protein
MTCSYLSMILTNNTLPTTINEQLTTISYKYYLMRVAQIHS